jgi:hypothetical protein
MSDTKTNQAQTGKDKPVNPDGEPIVRPKSPNAVSAKGEPIVRPQGEPIVRP